MTTFWLLLTLGFTASLWLTYVLDRFFRIGVLAALKNPRPGDEQKHAPWAQRAMAAHRNAVENLVVFAPLALVVITQGKGEGSLAGTAALVYFAARVAHFFTYAAGVSFLRTLAFSAGWGAQLAMLIAALGSGQS